MTHDSAHTHVTGESEFIDDRPLTQGEVHVDVVYSPHARARILRIDSTAAVARPHVLAVYTAKDFCENLWGTIFKDQPLLADGEVHFAGEPIAIVVGETRDAARDARAHVKVTYDVLPAIRSIKQARTLKSFIGSQRSIQRGDVEAALTAAPMKLEGSVVIRGADHFYLESQASIAYPKEDGLIEIHTSSQHPTEVQHVVSHALGIASKDVVCIVKRMGGAFGGKESQGAPFAAYAALVAKRLRRPARIVLTKDDDMIMTGKRNPFENTYRVGFEPTGQIVALDVQLYSDGGAYADLSTSIMERAMLHCDNAYFIPHFRVTGQVCRTHFHPHTAFRGFGGPKGVATIERVIEEIAHVTGKDPLQIRKLNCYTDRSHHNVTPYGQVVEGDLLPKLFHHLEESCDYQSRRKDITHHNHEVRTGKVQASLRGLSLTAVKFGISFTTRFLNQANAFVIVHRDGSVQVSTGATEMGQGVNARIAELVASEFGIPRSSVRLMATTTDKNANTSPTAASSGTDLNGAAAVLAARKIKARLSELALHLFKIPESKWAKHTAGLGTEDEIALTDRMLPTQDANADSDWATGVATFFDVEFGNETVSLKGSSSQSISFSSLINEAYHQRVSLSDYAHYKFQGLSFNKLTGKGQAFLYFTQGVAASEVAVDPMTGEAKVLRTDILMDLGRPILEGLDVGQITGGFVQGMGWVTTEKLFYSSSGLLLSHSPSTYKIPSIQDTPRDFRVALYPNNENRKNIRGTKAVGEPPLLLGISVWTAIHDALATPGSAYPHLELPATQEEILRALWPKRFEKWEGVQSQPSKSKTKSR